MSAEREREEGTWDPKRFSYWLCDCNDFKNLQPLGVSACGKCGVVRPAVPKDTSRDVVDAAARLVAKLEAIHADARYSGVWALAQLHHGPYTGPTYEAELSALTDALSRAPREEPGRGDGEPWRVEWGCAFSATRSDRVSWFLSRPAAEHAIDEGNRLWPEQGKRFLVRRVITLESPTEACPNGK